MSNHDILTPKGVQHQLGDGPDAFVFPHGGRVQLYILRLFNVTDIVGLLLVRDAFLRPPGGLKK